MRVASGTHAPTQPRPSRPESAARSRQRTAALLVACTLIAGAGKVNAASIAIVQGSFYTTDLRDNLILAGESVTEVASYTAASLAPFDAVIHYGNSFTDFPELESYVSAGGVLIETPWLWQNFAPTPPLQVVSNSPPFNDFSIVHPGVTVLNASDPMLAGVVFPPPGSFNIGRTRGNTFVGGAQQVAAWQDDGTPMIGWRSHGAGTVIAINLHVITSDTAYTVIDQPWAIQLFVNAANFTGAVCGNGTTEGGEACDEGALNGTPASCCDSSCQLRGAGELCRGAADACDAVETCDGASGACPTDVDLPDGDADGTCDAADNCPSAPNAGQENADGDAFGDACDPCVNDADDDVDADGVCGDVDNCPAAPNAGQENADGDALGDVCDACPSDPANDVDADGVCGDVDNCPVAANAGQEDADGDALGDACDTCTDTDADGYGTPGFPASTCDEDNCPSLANPAQADLDADGEGDLCDAEDAVGLSLRKLQVRKVPQPGKDKWSGQGDLATTATPTFLEDVDAGGLSVTLTHDDGTPVDAVAFTGSDCVRRGVNLNSMRCRDAAGNQVKLSKRPASSFFRIVAALKLRSLVLPTVADSPMRMAVTSPVAIDRVDGIGGCKAAPGVLKCADLP